MSEFDKFTDEIRVKFIHHKADTDKQIKNLQVWTAGALNNHGLKAADHGRKIQSLNSRVTKNDEHIEQLRATKGEGGIRDKLLNMRYRMRPTDQIASPLTS